MSKAAQGRLPFQVLRRKLAVRVAMTIQSQNGHCEQTLRVENGSCVPGETVLVQLRVDPDRELRLWPDQLMEKIGPRFSVSPSHFWLAN